MGREKQDSHWEIASQLPGKQSVLGPAGCHPQQAHHPLWPKTPQNADMAAEAAPGTLDGDSGGLGPWLPTCLSFHLKNGDEEPQPHFLLGQL